MPVPPPAVPMPLEFGPFRLDRQRRELRRGRDVLPLTPRVFDTLLALVQRRDRVAGKAELMAAVWPDRAVEEANLTQNVFVLRKLLGEREDARRYIATLPRRGYRFVAEVREVAEMGETEAAPARRAGDRRRPRLLMAALALAAGVATAVLALRSQATTPVPTAGASGRPARPERVRVIVQIHDARSEAPVWSRSYEGRPDELQRLAAEIAGTVGEELEPAYAR